MMTTLVRAIAAGDMKRVREVIRESPDLVTSAMTESCFIDEIKHQFYAGDTPLHVAVAGFSIRDRAVPDRAVREPCGERSAPSRAATLRVRRKHLESRNPEQNRRV